MEPTFDVCVIGHVTRDVVHTAREARTMPGGTALYCAVALKSLGVRVAVVTRLAGEDRELLSPLHHDGIPVFSRPSSATTVFENHYPGDGQVRVQRVISRADPFVASDVADVRARLYHLGPLVEGDMPAGLLSAVARKGLVSLDAQGFVRRVADGRVHPVGWPDMPRALPWFDILKADPSEARVLTATEDLHEAGQRLADGGVREVVITRGAKGALVYAQRRWHRIDALKPYRFCDPTGCGDTFMAAYLACRLRNDSISAAARFAAAAAALKLEHFGPFRGGAAAVHTRLASPAR
jgi:sugar/nucleoside kinase (ribokinase family)